MCLRKEKIEFIKFILPENQIRKKRKNAKLVVLFNNIQISIFDVKTLKDDGFLVFKSKK